jgi:quercetin dioxygenase-like cupin family protein
MRSNLAAMPKPQADPVKADPKHYSVEFENDKIRVLRIKYGPHEKSVMHGHPDGICVFLTDHRSKHRFSDGETQEIHASRGDTLWLEGREHLPENMKDQPMELILVELKQNRKK